MMNSFSLVFFGTMGMRIGQGGMRTAAFSSCLSSQLSSLSLSLSLWYFACASEIVSEVYR